MKGSVLIRELAACIYLFVEESCLKINKFFLIYFLSVT